MGNGVGDGGHARVSGDGQTVPVGVALVRMLRDGSAEVVAASASSEVVVGAHLAAEQLSSRSVVPLISVTPTGDEQALVFDRRLAPATPAPPRRAGDRVALVIDGEQAHRDYYAAVLEHLGWSARTAATGAAATVAFAASQPSLALVAVTLPDITGYDVSRQLRALDTRQCLVVLVSPDPKMIEPQRAADAGADLALLGPIGFGQLRAILEQGGAVPVRRAAGSVSSARSATSREAPAANVDGPQLKLFGEPHVTWGDDRWSLPVGVATDIVSVLSTRHPSALTTSELGALAWLPSVSTAGPVHTALSRMRAALTRDGCPDVVLTSHHRYRLAFPARSIDTLVFLMASSDLESVESSDRDYVNLAERVLQNVGDDAFGSSSLPAVAAARVRIAELRATIEERLSVRQILVGDTTGAVATARRLTAREMWRESAWTILVVALYRSGRQREALETFRVARNLLVSSVGVSPSLVLGDVERLVLTQDPALRHPEFIRSLAQ